LLSELSGVRIWELRRPLGYGYERDQAVFVASNEAVARCSLNKVTSQRSYRRRAADPHSAQRLALHYDPSYSLREAVIAVRDLVDAVLIARAVGAGLAVLERHLAAGGLLGILRGRTRMGYGNDSRQNGPFGLRGSNSVTRSEFANCETPRWFMTSDRQHGIRKDRETDMLDKLCN
jgi:hypothetical protein